MARLPDWVTADSEHIARSGDRLVVTITVDTSQFVAKLENLGPAWDRLDRWIARWKGAQRRHHRPERPHLSAMHTAYDRRRRARRRSRR